MRISAIDALQRGLLNLRANPMLVLWQVVQGLLVASVALAGLVPVVLALGAGALRTLWGAGQEAWSPAAGAEVERLAERAIEQWPLLLAALAASTAVWTVAFLVYCWFQAGVMSQLAAGEERAAADGRPDAGGFRVYSWPDFARAAGARVWKFFWLINLLALVGLAILLLLVLALGLVVALSGSRSDPIVAIVVGCLTMLVALVVFFFLFAWAGVAKAELVVAGGGVIATFWRSLRLLGRRLGAVLLLLVLFIAASLATGLVFAPLSLALDFAMGDSLARQIAADVALALIQTPINAALTVALSAALVALVRGER